MNLSDTESIEEVNIEEVNSGRGKKIAIIILIALPILVGIVFYRNNPTMRKNTNKILSKLPGSVGAYFEKTPTEAENAERVRYLSEYFLGVDADTAADKLYIIKKEDKGIFNSIIREMNLKSPEKTEEVVLKIRDLELRKNLLSSVYDEVKEDELSAYRSEISRLESQDLLLSKEEFERRFSNKDFQQVVKGMKPDSLAKVLYFVDLDVKTYIISLLDSNLRDDVNMELNKIELEREKLKSIAKYHETKSITEIIEALGNTGLYDMDELAYIYSNMSLSRVSRVLSNIDNNKFIEELFSAIKKEEQLVNGSFNLVDNISRNIDFFVEYNEKIAKLRKVYGDMSPKQVADITEKMIENDKNITVFNIDVHEAYNISDRTIIIDILSGMKRNQVSKVLDTMKVDKAAQVTELLAIPEDKYIMGGESYDDKGN